MTIISDIDYLLEYTAWERTQWERWFSNDGGAASLEVGLGPNVTGSIGNIGELARHIFAAEQRYVERIQGVPLSDTSGVSAHDARALFDFGRTTRQHMQQLLRDFPAERWEAPMEVQFGPRKATLLPKTMVVQSLTHELRHWAQAATLLRMAGYKVGSHDFLFAGIFENQAVGSTAEPPTAGAGRVTDTGKRA